MLKVPDVADVGDGLMSEIKRPQLSAVLKDGREVAAVAGTAEFVGERGEDPDVGAHLELFEEGNGPDELDVGIGLAQLLHFLVADAAIAHFNSLDTGEGSDRHMYLVEFFDLLFVQEEGIGGSAVVFLAVNSDLAVELNAGIDFSCGLGERLKLLAHLNAGDGEGLDIFEIPDHSDVLIGDRVGEADHLGVASDLTAVKRNAPDHPDLVADMSCEGFIRLGGKRRGGGVDFLQLGKFA